MPRYLAIVLLMGATVQLTHAATDWYVATNGVSPNDGYKWSTAFTNIQDALDTAADGDAIYVAGQSFVLATQLVWNAKTNVIIRGGYAATNDADTPGPCNAQQWPTVVGLATGVNSRIISISNVASSLLERIVVTGGTLSGGGSLYGGGLYITGSTGLVLSACVISNNTLSGANSTVYGGGIYTRLSVLTLSNCAVRANVAGTSFNAVSALGGGIYEDGGTLIMRDTIIANNRSEGSNVGGRYGGAVYVNGGICSLRNCLIVGNAADGGYGDAFYKAGAAGALILENCTVAYNPGQGINRNAGTVIVTNTIVWGNGDDIVGAITLGSSDIGNADSNGFNGCFSADPRFERGFYLATNSPCVDAGTNDSSAWELDGFTTRADGSNDTGRVDVGYHSPTGYDLGPNADIYVAADGNDSLCGGTSWTDAYRTITKALSVLRDGTRVYVGSGTYNTNCGEMFPLTIQNLTGVRITGTNSASTIVDVARSADRVFTVINCNALALAGMTLSGGYQNKGVVCYGGGVGLWTCGGVDFSDCAIVGNFIYGANKNTYGGGIYSRSSAVTMSDCQVSSNVAATSVNAVSPYGGGLYLQYGVVTMRDSLIISNRCVGGSGSVRWGGGLYDNNAICRLWNCLVATNCCFSGWGDGLYMTTSDGYGSPGNMVLNNCTVAGNGGQGLNCGAGTAMASNSVFWGNVADTAGNVGLAYCDMQSGISNGVNGCVSFDPLFVDTMYYHLQSKLGNYSGGYFSGGSWSTSASNSPIVDLGDPAADYSREPEPNGGQVNMGYDGNSLVASLTDTSAVYTLPVVTNLGATRVGHRTARLNGQITDTGGQIPDCQFAYWAVGDSATSTVPVGPENGAFFADVSGLDPSNVYQYAIFASNSAGGVWSDTQLFETHPVGFEFYVATNGDDRTGASWSTAYTTPKTVMDIIEPRDTVFVAGHTFRLEGQLVWNSAAGGVRIAGGYAGTNDADRPGPYSATAWPTIFLVTGVNSRVMWIGNVATGMLERVALSGGYMSGSTAIYGGGVYITGSTGFVFSACTISNNALSANNNSPYGGGIYANNSDIVFSNCAIHGNTAGTSGNYPGAFGGGIYVAGGRMTLCRTTVVSNRCSGSNGIGRYGGGLYNDEAVCMARNCLVAANSAFDGAATGYGDGLYAAVASTTMLENCTVAYNAGQGINPGPGVMAITNSIIWGNGDDLTGAVILAYCDIQTSDACWTNGENGCVSVDPLFVDNTYCHLMSKSGCYLGGYFSDGTWGGATNYSPCIDAGDPGSSRLLEPSPNGKRVNMGAYGNTEVASKSPGAGTALQVR